MISPICCRCKKELNAPGAILLHPPKPSFDGTEYVVKDHLCAPCFGEIQTADAEVARLRKVNEDIYANGIRYGNAQADTNIRALEDEVARLNKVVEDNEAWCEEYTGTLHAEIIRLRRAELRTFAMLIEDVVTIVGRGTVVVGKVMYGEVHAGDKLVVHQPTGDLEVTCRGIESFSTPTPKPIGLLVGNVPIEDIQIGVYITGPT